VHASARCHYIYIFFLIGGGDRRDQPLAGPAVRIALHSAEHHTHPPTHPINQIGEKQYFAEENICSSRMVGGVTLNHLVWARTLGAPTGLMALQGADEVGLSPFVVCRPIDG
jgi:hypothetical protein